MTNLVVNQVVEKMNRMPPKLQRRVLSYVESLSKPEKPGIVGKKLLKFSGSIPADDLVMMKKAIDDGCEQVNPNEW